MKRWQPDRIAGAATSRTAKDGLYFKPIGARAPDPSEGNFSVRAYRRQ
jgi:hypothetical protein